MLHWPSPWHTSSDQPQPKAPSVIEKWLVDTGRKPLPRARYTARRRRSAQSSAPNTAPALSFPLIWPTRPSSDAPATLLPTPPKGHPFDDYGQPHASRAPSRGTYGYVTATTDAGDVDAADSTPDTMWDDSSHASIYLTSPTDWRERITEMIDMGMTHYNVCNCTEGAMPTKDDIARYDALFREVVADNPEVGSIEVIPGYPPIYVLLGAADAAQLYAERRQRERDEQRQVQ
ncbi:hypothetical protein pmac_cds_789 [Pandoravirus macleodensis]|uniref:Uncharacterized protein n=1 Tax=Pandoravirus macleodensis TaxID=2107707 RepID=A0A2U7UG64_9VIRU|nr:hypothetical protein pmac_cds_789 [Pandoravirus macleodensis]AVK77477.1 hypothetical protein pmac_cds_789 [Pandoravirus macleodensis]